MPDLQQTQHAIVRMAQRGIQPDDLPWIMAIATEVPEGLLVTNKDIAEIERHVKAFTQCLRHINGKLLIARDGALITAYHATKRQASTRLRARTKVRGH